MNHDAGEPDVNNPDHKDKDAAGPLFALSIPERAVRSLLGTAGGTARELSHVLVPPAVRETRIWNAAIERSLQILAEGVGNVKLNKTGAQEVDVARMAVGSVVDTAALVVFHVSPLWCLAVVHDIASGSRKYLDNVVAELRERGALEKDINIKNIDHLLTVLERTAGELQSDVDRPPLSVAELRASAARIRDGMAAGGGEWIGGDAALQVAKELEEVSARDGSSLRAVSNAVALSLATRARFARRAASAGADVAARLLVERGWKPYRDQLRSVRRTGFARYLAAAARPLADAIVTNFDPATDTFTGQLLSGRLWESAIAQLRSERGKRPPPRGGITAGNTRL